MSNTISENITRRILHEELMKLVCEDETPVATGNGTWIYGVLTDANGKKRILFHTLEDHNGIESVKEHFWSVTEAKYEIKSIDFIFNCDDLSLMDIPNTINAYMLDNWVIVPENIAKTLVPEMKKWNEDTIKRNKIKNVFCSTFESVGRKVPYRLQK